MINEIYVIQESGIPIYYYNQEQSIMDLDWKDESYTLQAGFFAAIVQFGSELTQDELRYIVFNNRTYGIKKSKEVYIVFSEKVELSVERLKDLDKKLQSASNFISENISGDQLQILMAVSEKAMEEVVSGFSNFLVKEKIIEETSAIDESKVKKQVQNFVFKAVGYQPGRCNIGPKERMQRLSVGMISIAIGMFLFAAISWLSTININFAFLTFILIFPFFIGFNGVYQYFFRFCVTNALKKQFNMT
jgi:hypothetical protein